MPRYIRRSISSQLCCLYLTLALLALPLAGTRAERGPNLVALATELVPLVTVLQAPTTDPSQLPVLVASTRLALGLLASAAFVPNPDSGDRFQIIAGPDLADSGAIDNPHGRSPPSV
jgi:hypothetical protein